MFASLASAQAMLLCMLFCAGGLCASLALPAAPSRDSVSYQPWILAMIVPLGRCIVLQHCSSGFFLHHKRHCRCSPALVPLYVQGMMHHDLSLCSCNVCALCASHAANPCLLARHNAPRYEEDIRLAKEANCNAFRLSIEWARVEPKRGVIDQAAVKR